MDSLLDGVRVLDLTDEKGLLCGRMLADLGADVIKVEKPGGDDARHIGPFYHDIPHPEKSLSWFAYNLNKRGITLDIRTSDGRALLKQLSARADIIIESFPVGYLDELGLGYSSIAAINPKIIMASISPFGQNGPYKNYKATDLVGMAMGGYLYLCGEPEKPPVRISYPQSYLHAASEAASAIMIALYHRDISDEGQYIDVSMQQSIVVNTIMAVPFWQLNNVILERSGAFRVGLTSGTRQRQTWKCKDGQVNFVIYGGKAGATRNRNLLKWMAEDGMTHEYFKDLDFDTWDIFNITQDDWNRVEEPIGRFFLSHTKEELFTQGTKHKVAVSPVYSPSEVVNSQQLKERGFWIDVHHPELSTTIRYPGFCLKFSQTPCRILRRPPLIGEHNNEIYHDELGLSKDEIITLTQAKTL